MGSGARGLIKLGLERIVFLGSGGCSRAGCGLGTITGAALTAGFYAGGVKFAPDDVIFNTGQVFDPASTDQNNAVLGQVVTDAGNVGSDFSFVGQTDPGHFS